MVTLTCFISRPLFCFPLLTFSALKINSLSCFLEIAWHLGRPCGRFLVIPVFLFVQLRWTHVTSEEQERQGRSENKRWLMRIKQRLTLKYTNGKTSQTRWWNTLHCICSGKQDAESFWQVLLHLFTPQSSCPKLECIVHHCSHLNAVKLCRQQKITLIKTRNKIIANKMQNKSNAYVCQQM